MPFKSEAQRKYLYANHPEVAKEFEAHTPQGTKLPARVDAKKSKKRKVAKYKPKPHHTV